MTLVEQYEFGTAQAFALLLETAAEQFATLRGLVDGKFLFFANANDNNAMASADWYRANACIRMALAKEFLFNAARTRL